MNTTILNEMREAVKNETAQILTLDKAKELIGKKIKTIYFGYRGQDGADEFEVKEIISDWELAARNIDAKNFPQGNQQLYWDSYMTDSQKKEHQSKLVILSERGNTCIFCHQSERFFSEPTFTCSDADRAVYYIVISE